MAKVTGKVFRLEKKSLRRVLGSWDLFSVGYGDVGSSIYYALGVTALYALGATPLALLAAGVVFICTALTYAEMSSTFPEPGGSATFTRYAFNDLISFIAGWGLLLDYIVTIAISAFAVPPYLHHVLQLIGIKAVNSVWFHCTFSIGIIVFLFFLNFFGIKGSGRFSLMLAIFTILTQVAIILMGALLFLNLPLIISHMRIGVPGVDWSPDWWGFAKGTAMAMVAYTGIEAISQLAAEAKQPAQSIPRAIKWTAVVIIFLYVGLSTVGLSVLTPLQLGTTYVMDPIGGIAENFPIGGAILGSWVGLIAAIILLIAANAGLIGCSRLVFSMGQYYQVPSFCYKIHKRFHTPYVTLIIFAVLSSVIIAVSRGKMLFLADLYNFGAQMAFFSVHMALLVLRWKHPELKRPYRAPFNIPFGKGRSLPITAILGALASLAVWLLVVATKVEGRIAGLFWIAMGIGMYLLYRRKEKMSVMGHIRVEKIHIPQYQPIHIKHILAAPRSATETETLQTAFEMARVHKAKITVVYVLDVPNSMPIHATMPKRERMGEAALERAEAIGHEFHLQVEMKLIRARSFESALLELSKSEHCDLIIAGASYKELQRGAFANQAEELLKDSRCRVIFCRF